MQISQISFSNNLLTKLEPCKSGSNNYAVSVPENKTEESQDNKKTLKYVLIGGGFLIAIIAAIKHKKISEMLGTLFSKNSKPKQNIPTTTTVEKGTQDLADMLSGKASSEQLAAGAKNANEKSQEILKFRQKFPELLINREERRIKFERNKDKFRKGALDLDYFKDEFRINVTVPAERLKILKESTNPELRKMFDIDRKMFQINDGVVIHGSDIPEKKQLLDALIEDATKHDMTVIRIQAGDSDPITFAQQIAKLFPEAKQRFLTDKKHTMFVIEDADKMLNLKDKTLSTANGPCRGAINVHTNNCGFEGITWVATIKDLSKIDESCYRGGRISQVVDIDKAVGFST